MSLLHPDDPTEYMVAMAPIMIAGTTVGAASVFIESGVDTAIAQFPVLMLTCPESDQLIETISGGYQATFQVYATYMDRWEADARSFELILADAKAAVYAMARNIRATPDLGMVWNGLSNVVQANNRIRIRTNRATTDLGLGFPLVTSVAIIEIIGPYFR